MESTQKPSGAELSHPQQQVVPRGAEVPAPAPVRDTVTRDANGSTCACSVRGVRGNTGSQEHLRMNRKVMGGEVRELQLIDCKLCRSRFLDTLS